MMEDDAATPSGLVLTDAVLDELKKQSSAGCLLCILGTFDEEDWD